MLSDLNQSFAVVNEVFQEASDAISVDLWKIIHEDQEALNLTENTQPVMLAAGYATYKILSEEMSLSPTSMAGHSLGEYTALVSSNSLNFFDAIRLVKKRGELMQSAVPNGAGSMAAILGLDDDLVVEKCIDASVIGVVEVRSVPEHLRSGGAQHFCCVFFASELRCGLICYNVNVDACGLICK